MSTETNRENMDKLQSDNPPAKTEESTHAPQAAPSQTTSTNGGINKPNTSKENTGIAIKHAESESLNSLLAYDSDSSSSSSYSEMIDLDLKWEARDKSGDTSSSSSDDDDVRDDENSEETSDEDEEEFSEMKTQDVGAIRKQPVRKNNTDGDVSLDQLPPVPDLSTLNLNVEHEQFVHMGGVLGIVDKLVTVAALPNSPPYDLDTLLFLDNGKRPLGFVFDVLGQVSSPIYAVRFNTAEDIKNLQVEVGTRVYSAPLSKHTQYVFLQHLLKMKGSDASWLGDSEVPTEFADYSDDENECQHVYSTLKPGPHLKRTHSSDNYKKFESTMNRKNLLNTKFNKYMDSCKQTKLGRMRHKQEMQVPRYDPTVPPPNFGFVSYGGGGENNNSGCVPHMFMNNFVANLSQTNSANYFTNHAAGNNYPGPSHQ